MTESLADKAYKALREDIINCSLKPGQQIVQAQLSDAYGFGATPIREALQRLAQDGLVESVPRFGYVVSPITLRDVRETYELRLIIESSVARLAATRGSQEQLERILEACKFSYVYGDRDSYTEFLSRNIDFHRSVAVAAGNERVVDLLTCLLQEMSRIYHLGLDLIDRPDKLRSEHIDLAEALLARDPDRAEQVVRSHVETFEARVSEALTLHESLEFRQSEGAAIEVRLSSIPGGTESA
jgi:DNA-binding GntR family transcriptional regulator